MKRRTMTMTVLVGSLAVGLVAGCASGPSQSSGLPRTGDVVADRQLLMKTQGQAMSEINAKLKTGNIDGVATDAEMLTRTAREIPELFPAGSTSPKSRAKPEIWQKRAEFEGYAKSLGEQSKKVAAIARTKDQAATQAAVAEMGRAACGACHDAFRGPEIKS
jgi:cytochrome c556